MGAGREREHGRDHSGCPACAAFPTGSEGLDWDHVHEAAELPAVEHTDARHVIHGYLVRLGSHLGAHQRWFFFGHLEPALVFGRAARMSASVSSYGVHAAATEAHQDPANPTRDITTIHVRTGTGLDRADDELQHFDRWLRATRARPESSHYHPPPRE